MFKKTIFLCFIFSVYFLLPLYAKAINSWELTYQPRQRVVKSIGIYNEEIFIGTGNGVFHSKDYGKTWKDFGTNQLLKDNSGNCSVNWIVIDNEKIYIATSFGAYYSGLLKPNWHKFTENTKAGLKKIDSTTDDIDLSEEEKDLSSLDYEDDSSLIGQINSISRDNGQVYLSSNDGFWICDVDLKTKCKRLNQGLEPDNDSGNYQINYFLKLKNDLYLASSNGVYVFDNKNSLWENISSGIQKRPDGRINARHLFVDKEQNLWIACETGIFQSVNKGKSWLNKSDGIKTNTEGYQGAFYFFESNEILYLASESGVYFFNKQQGIWENLAIGIRTKESSKNVYWLAKLNNDIYAATDEGLFVLHQSKQEDKNDKSVLKGEVETDFADLEGTEPTVVEVQKQALKFASLPTQSDYKRYRTQARLRNLVPKVNFDANTTGTNLNYFQFENGISTNTSLNNAYNGGNTKRFQHDGRSYKQLSVQWDTNQFIYDDEIWRILNQARLTANIKENLLDDVTRIYYERRKLQLSTLLNPTTDLEKHLSNHIEIAELTGQIDSRTGGWFSEEIEKRKGNLVKLNDNN